MKIERFEDIEAWQLARELTRKVYCLIINYLKKYEDLKTINREQSTVNCEP